MTSIKLPRASQIAAMQALFDLAEAFKSDDLSITDLQEVIELSLEAGHDMMIIQLSMAVMALEGAKKSKSLAIADAKP